MALYRFQIGEEIRQRGRGRARRFYKRCLAKLERYRIKREIEVSPEEVPIKNIRRFWNYS